MSKRYLFWFAYEHIDFRQAEIDSLLSLFNTSMKFIEEPSPDVLYWIVEMDSEESARKIASRSISLRWCLELWGRAKTIENLHINMKESLVQNSDSWSEISFTDSCGFVSKSSACPRKLMEPYFSSQIPFKITVETFCKHFSNEEKIQKIENFSYMPFEGPVRLKNPDVDVMFLEYYGINQNKIPDKPYDVFIGRKLAEGQRHLISRLSLKNRKFIGNTSMDAQLSLLMANQAQIKKGDLVIDPFVGSGSLLIAAAEFGAYVWGSDIDYLMIHARSRPSRVKQKVREKDESIKGNMFQYKTHHQYLDVIVSDFSMPLWRDSLKFDAIITDPPYGIRESTEKIGIERENYTLSPEHLNNHIPSKIDYSLPQIYIDLLDFAAKHLHTKKKLVCWYPYYREDYDSEKLPKHGSLKLIGNSEQILSKLTARRLLTYEKLDEGDSPRGSPLKNVIGLDNNDTGTMAPSLDFKQKYYIIKEQIKKEKREREKETGFLKSYAEDVQIT